MHGRRIDSIVQKPADKDFTESKQWSRFNKTSETTLKSISGHKPPKYRVTSAIFIFNFSERLQNILGIGVYKKIWRNIEKSLPEKKSYDLEIKTSQTHFAVCVRLAAVQI